MDAQEIPSPPDAERPAGEARSRRRRQIFVAIFAFSLLLGLAVGVGMGMAEGGDLTLTRETSWGLAAAAALLIAGFSVGLHAGLAAGVPWAFLAHLGHAPDLDLSVLFLIIVGSAALYYTAVKLWRLF
jgi:hypothetical protein